MARPLLVVNPFASGVTDARTEQVAAALGDVDVRLTERPGHGTELVREAAGRVPAIYVFSGDGGFNEALNGVDRDTPLGFVPGGGASVLPRALGLPRDTLTAARRLREGSPRRMTVGRANGRRFGFSAGVGLDAAVVRRVDALGRTRERGRAGNVVFAREAARVLAESRFALHPALEIEGHGRAAFVLCANGDPYTYAGPVPLHVAPRADFERGVDVVGVRRLRARAVPRLLWYLLRGRGHERAREVVYLHDVDRVRIVCDGALPLQVDGEDLGDVEELVVEAERGAVTVLV